MDDPPMETALLVGQPSQVDDLPGWTTLLGRQPSEAPWLCLPAVSRPGLLPLAPARPATTPVHDPSPSSGLCCWLHTTHSML